MTNTLFSDIPITLDDSREMAKPKEKETILDAGESKRIVQSIFIGICGILEHIYIFSANVTYQNMLEHTSKFKSYQL